MVDLLNQINQNLNDFVWGAPAMVCILFVGLLFLFRNKAVQIRKFPLSMKETFGKIFKKRSDEKGSITPFQALCTALAATVGTGNIAGVAGAIALGGPGAVFWMWVSAILGMGVKFAEITLAVHYRERNKYGDYVGGPMYYIKNGLSKNWRWLAYVFAALGCIAVFGTGSTTQINTVVTSIDTALLSFDVISADSVEILNLILGIILAIIVGVVLLGGIKRIGTVTEKLVPFMAILYIVLALGVIFINVENLPAAFASIFYGAFNPAAVTGGIVGSMFLCMKKGLARGVFSNEAGLGTGSIAHATTETKEPVKQGLFGIFEVFIDTIVICTMTALVILCSGISIEYGKDAGAELTINGFVSSYGEWVTIFTAIAMCCFAFSTVLGWGLYGSRCIEFLLNEKWIRPFMIVFSLSVILGATIDLGSIWTYAETANGLMAIPNLIALFLLSGTVVKLTKEYFSKNKEEKRLPNNNSTKSLKGEK